MKEINLEHLKEELKELDDNWNKIVKEFSEEKENHLDIDTTNSEATQSNDHESSDLSCSLPKFGSQYSLGYLPR